MAKRVHILSKSRLDEPGFRFMLKQKAEALGLKGYCRMNENNCLEIEVEGKNNSIDEFLRFLQKGPFTFLSIEMSEHVKGYGNMEIDIV